MFFRLLLGFVLAGVLTLMLARADEPKPGDAQTPAASAPDSKPAKPEEGKLKGRLPQYYSKLDVSSEQRQKIYKIQASYAAKKDALEKQLEELKSQCSAETRTVLTADQQAKLDELVGSRKSKKSKDTKPAEPTGTAPGAPASNTLTQSAAK